MNGGSTAGYMQIVPQPYNYCPYCGHCLTGYTAGQITTYSGLVGGAVGESKNMKEPEKK